MLKRLYIDNFRCFVNFEYKPERKQLLLGANGSGKSSLLDSIELLKDFLRGIDNPFLATTTTRWLKLPEQVFEIEASLDGKAYVYRVENHFAQDAPVGEVRLERLTVSGEVVFEQLGGNVRFFAQKPETFASLPWKTTRSSLNLARLSTPEVDRFLTWIFEHVFCIRIDPWPDAMSDTTESEDALPENELDNLSAWYRHLVQADPEANLELLRSLTETLDGFVSLQLEAAGASTRILRAIFLQAGKKSIPYPLSDLSDGQRCLIALYMVLHFLISKQGNTVFIDEPDNFVSLREIQPWLISAEDATETHKSQLILISHHPEILNQWAREFGLLFRREGNGQVMPRPFTTVTDTGLAPAETVARGWEDE
ncbi:MAG: AAA family ATPase [Terracidiphilus sp.]